MQENVVFFILSIQIFLYRSFHLDFSFFQHEDCDINILLFNTFCFSTFSYGNLKNEVEVINKVIK